MIHFITPKIRKYILVQLKTKKDVKCHHALRKGVTKQYQKTRSRHVVHILVESQHLFFSFFPEERKFSIKIKNKEKANNNPRACFDPDHHTTCVSVKEGPHLTPSCSLFIGPRISLPLLPDTCFSRDRDGRPRSPLSHSAFLRHTNCVCRDSFIFPLLPGDGDGQLPAQSTTCIMRPSLFFPF